MHILVHCQKTGLPFLIPIERAAVMPCAQQGGGAIRFDGYLFLTKEPRDALIAAFQANSKIIVPILTKDEHQQSINERAAAEAATVADPANPTFKEAVRGLRAMGALMVNAISHRKRREALLPDGFPPMFTDQKGEHFVKDISNAALVELYAYALSLDGEQTNKAVACYQAYLELMAGSDC